MSSIFRESYQILERHLDSFGHMNNATYLEFYEQARWNFITKRGWGLERIQNEQRGPVILEVNCSFRKELANRETFVIESQFAGMKNRLSFYLHQKMIKENGQVASEAKFISGFFDLKERKLLPPPVSWLEALGVEPSEIEKILN